MITTGENDLIYFKREEWHMFTLLMLGSGIFWTATYILIIRRSFLDHTYGMPLVALCANISWEGIFSFIYPPFIIQHVVNLVWFALDMVIFIQLLRYGPREFADLSKRAFYGVCSLTLLTGFGAFFLFSSLSHRSVLLPFLYVAIFVYDVIYLGMVYKQQRDLTGPFNNPITESNQMEIPLS